MGTVAIQTQRCLQERDDEWETDEEGAPEEKVQLVDVPWLGRSGGGSAGAPARAPAAVPRSLSDATVVPTG